jgi:hypothetical protein
MLIQHIEPPRDLDGAVEQEFPERVESRAGRTRPTERHERLSPQQPLIDEQLTLRVQRRVPQRKAGADVPTEEVKNLVSNGERLQHQSSPTT